MTKKKVFEKPEIEDPNKGIEVLCKKIIRIAQYESEIELGVNPSDFEQANTCYLTERDFEYINRVEALVEKKLKNLEWINATIDKIKGNAALFNYPLRGVKFDDELFRAGRGILENYLIEKYKK